jgi:hypothetical protein
MRGDYEVYEINSGKPCHLAWCPSQEVACAIALSLAKCDPKAGAYYEAYDAQPGEWVPGGGGYIRYQRNKEGRVERFELS